MKNSQWLGVGAALLVIAACFMPWAWYPDLQKEFTGFFSEQNRYGRPGKVLMVFSIAEMIFFLIPRIWAKRANIFVSAVGVAWGIKSYISFTGCYRGICPEARIGLWLVLAGTVVAFAASLLPDVPVKDEG